VAQQAQQRDAAERDPLDEQTSSMPGFANRLGAGRALASVSTMASNCAISTTAMSMRTEQKSGRKAVRACFRVANLPLISPLATSDTGQPQPYCLGYTVNPISKDSIMPA
jgi:hypothetical protein